MTRRPGFIDELPAEEVDEASTAAELGAPPEPPATDVVPPLGPMLFDFEGATEQRIDPVWEPALASPRRRGAGPLNAVAAGLLVMLGTWAVLSAIGFVQDQFHRSVSLGVVALGGMTAGTAMIGIAIWREWRAYRHLKRVDGLRRAMALSDARLELLKLSAAEWVRTVRRTVPDADAVLARIEAAADPALLHAVLRRDVARPLGDAARRLGRRAALEGGALVAITPSPALDGILSIWRGIALVRRVAELHGLRPGPLVTLALLRQVAWTAAGVSGFAQLSQSLADHTLHQLPIIRHLAGALPETGLAAMRLYRLATITAETCLPIDAEP